MTNFAIESNEEIREMRIVLAVLASASLVGCAATYQRETIVAHQNKLVVGGSVLVATPRDATYGSAQYAGSGSSTATAVQSAFARYTKSSDVSSSCLDFKCLKSTPTSYDYYAVPQILHWEDRATEWSGKKDKIEIKLTIYSPTGEVVGSNVISGKSKWATFGGDHPQDLLAAPISEYVRSLF